MFPHQIANAPLRRLTVSARMAMPGTVLPPSFLPPRGLVPGISPPQPGAGFVPQTFMSPQTLSQVSAVSAPTSPLEDEDLGHKIATATGSGGFEWHQNGLSVWTTAPDGQAVRVFFPLHQIDLVFQRETARVGCPLGQTVGDFSVGGLFKKIGRGLKKFHNIITFKKLRQKAGRAIKKQLEKSKFGRGLLKAGKAIHGVAKKVASVGKKVIQIGGKIIRSKPFRAILGAAAVAFPAIAPGVVALEAAQQVMDRVEKAKKTAQNIARGIRNPGDALALAAGKRAEATMTAALKGAERHEADGMEMAGALHAIQQRRKGGTSSKAAKRAMMLARRRRSR